MTQGQRIQMDVGGVMEKMGLMSKGSGSQKSGMTPVLPQSEDYSDWSQLADLILDAEISDEIASGIAFQRVILDAKAKGIEGVIEKPAPVESAMKALALKVATGIEELQGIRDSINADVWQTKKLERAIRREQIRNRMSNYAELEFISIQRLIEQVEKGKVTSPGELIAIAHLGAKMTHLGQIRSDSMSEKPNGQSAGINIDMQINQITSSHPNGDLPGAGHLGPIRLSLGSRVRSQLEAAIPERKNGSDSYLDGIEMLTAKEVQGELLSDRDDSGMIIDVEKESGDS